MFKKILFVGLVISLLISSKSFSESPYHLAESDLATSLTLVKETSDFGPYVCGDKYNECMRQTECSEIKNLCKVFIDGCQDAASSVELNNAFLKISRCSIAIAPKDIFHVKFDFCPNANDSYVIGEGCVCDDGFEKNEDGNCVKTCPEGEELVGDECYKLSPKTCDEGYELDETDTCVKVDIDCEDGQVFDSDQNKCIDMDITDAEGGGCSINEIANPLSLILLLSFLIPVFKKRK